MIDMKDLQAKSDQMNAVDFVQPMLMKMKRVDYYPKQEQPIHIHFDGFDGRPYKPCKSMLRGLTQVWGMDEKKWPMAVMELYCDPTVKWAGKEAGGIRISGLSGLSKPFEFVVTLNRSQRKIHKFNVVADNADTTKRFVFTHWEADINEAKDNGAIDAILKQVKHQFGDEAQMQLKDAVITARAKFQK